MWKVESTSILEYANFFISIGYCEQEIMLALEQIEQGKSLSCAMNYIFEFRKLIRANSPNA